MVNKLFDCSKHPRRYFKQHFSMLIFIFADVYHLQKMFNHFVYNTYYIVDDIISCKWLINILFAVCKLFVWISEVIYQLQRYYVNNFHTVIIKVSEDFTWWSNENILLWMHQSDALWLFGTMKKKCLMKNIFKVKSTCK